MNLRQTAQAYQPPQTHNISELDKIDIDKTLVTEEERETKEGKSFRQNVIDVNGIKYRVPSIVLKNLKVILEKIPNLKYISVLKQGEGMETTYQVLPLTN
jgi:hypothetical protein